MLEELARDVTGWAAHAVEFFELLGWTQHLEHIRPQARWFDVRSLERDSASTARSTRRATASTCARSPSTRAGTRPQHRLLPLAARRYPLLERPGPPAGAAAWAFHFSPLGNAAPLFTHLRREGDEAGLSTELHVPAPIRRAFFKQDLARTARRSAAATSPTSTGDRGGAAAPLAPNPTPASS